MRRQADGSPRGPTGCALSPPPARRNGAQPRPGPAAGLPLLAALAAVAWSPGAAAQRTEGTVLQIEGNELLVDLGTADGVAPGDTVWLYRRISVEHPLTHDRIEDRFPIGEEQLAQVAERMAIIVLDTPLDHPPALGDTVVLQRTGRPPGQAGAGSVSVAQCPACDASTCPAPPPCDLDPEVQALLLTFGRTLGQPLDQRIVIWEEYLASHPTASWSAAVSADVETLRGMLRVLRGGEPALSPGGQPRTGHEPPRQAYVGEPVEIVFAIDPRASLRLAQFHVRRSAERGYQPFDMEADGDYYLRAGIPAEFVVPDGFEYFIVGVATNGEEVSLGGSSERPIRVPVVSRVEAPPVRTDRSNLHTSFEYVDFYADYVARDYYLRFETDFRYVVGTWFYGLRMGFGIFEGSGAPVDGTDWAGDNSSLASPEPISYRYGFAELEFKLHDLFYIIGRISFGSARAYAQGNRAPEALVGGGGKIRIGRPDGTNLELGGGYIEQLGYEANVSVNLGLVDDVPLRAHIIVTDMPVQQDLGVRLVAEAGWRPVSWFEFTGVAGYDIRTIHHTGFSLGLATAFLW